MLLFLCLPRLYDASAVDLAQEPDLTACLCARRTDTHVFVFTGSALDTLFHIGLAWTGRDLLRRRDNERLALLVLALDLLASFVWLARAGWLAGWIDFCQRLNHSLHCLTRWVGG